MLEEGGEEMGKGKDKTGGGGGEREEMWYESGTVGEEREENEQPRTMGLLTHQPTSTQW